ncbi:claspin isoform X1 [Plutella xylostella]|uniref:claspin isoform X1 n=1 Tax=Plutella xylostella TaxID=51655 RepID=UPI00203235F1|nr:claspin isoform X1 [Plutella xylostella]
MEEDSSSDEITPSVPQEQPGTENKQESYGSDESEDEIGTTKKAKKRTEIQSESDSERSETEAKSPVNAEPKTDRSDNDRDQNSDVNFKTQPKKSRIQNMSSTDNSSDSDRVDEQTLIPEAKKNEEQQARMKSKKHRLKDKFKNLTKSREKPSKLGSNSSASDNDISVNKSKSNHTSDEEDLSSIEKIKQIIKDKSTILKSTIYDTDTSSDEGKQNSQASKAKRRSTKLTSPKPIRLSAKQAMDNMNKIKSESNRMLREKEVSLPYHRPKALALKDILSRRKPVLTSDGKALPLKMNEEQLKEYAHLLEQRQKEMMELCKSESEEEETATENPEVSGEPGGVAANDTSKQCQSSQSSPNSNEELKNLYKSEDKIDSDVANASEIEKPITVVQNTDVDANDNNTMTENNQSILNDKEASKNDISFDNVMENCTRKEVKETVSNDNDCLVINTEKDSQLISLQYDTEKTEENSDCIIDDNRKKDDQVISNPSAIDHETENNIVDASDNLDHENIETEEKDRSENYDKSMDDVNGFSDNDFEMEDIDRIIENAEIIDSQLTDSPMLVKDSFNLNKKPKLTGAPGMVIDLDGSSAASRKVSGVELLKQRFTYFNKLKTAKEIEIATQQKIKPGTQHLKLKQELEEQMAEQRSLEWAKRLEEEKQNQMELNAVRGDDSDEEEDDIEKIEAKLAEEEAERLKAKACESEEEDELEENDISMEDKPREKNPMVADEAEETDGEDEDNPADENNEDIENKGDDENDGDDESDEDSSDESSDEDIAINDTKQKKGRIVKAFEDSDEEIETNQTNKDSNITKDNSVESLNNKSVDNAEVKESSEMNSQDDEIQLAQLQKSYSEDLFTSQETDMKLTASIQTPFQTKSSNEDNIGPSVLAPDSDDISKEVNDGKHGGNVAVICETQPFDDAKFDDIAGMCSGSFSQAVPPTQLGSSQPTQTPEIGEDLLALCTGKFYDNEFISQDDSAIPEENQHKDSKTKEDTVNEDEDDVILEEKNDKVNCTDKKHVGDSVKDDGNLKSILDELNDPEFDDPKPNKFFTGGSKVDNSITQKKRFVIESDDEGADTTEKEVKIKKKIKKKKLQDRALQISDDEEELSEEENEEESASEAEEEDPERVVEYDSEENEVQIQAPPKKKLKRKVGEFFEQEAELTSEDEWVGSGDEDEAGLDRLEREAGDDDVFHQGKLQTELGQIHMRDVLDQDRREVRILQELLFEDGDLGEGHRQRKFRWKYDEAEGEEARHLELGELGTQEDEMESEVEWRRQRHERQLFLRQMKQEGDQNEPLLNTFNTTGNTTLTSKNTSTLLEVNTTADGIATAVPLPKITKDVISPTKKAFPMLQKSYRGSLLSRGSGALGRLAALATPLAGDGDERPNIGSLKTGKGNFVFAAVSPTPEQPKVSKRKKDSNTGTPTLMKKLKTEEKRDFPRSSLIDHFNI